MSEIYQGPIYRNEQNSNNSYSGDEILRFADGTEVAISRDMYDTSLASLDWPVATGLDDVVEKVVRSYGSYLVRSYTRGDDAEKTIHVRVAGHEVIRCNYELTATSMPLGQSAVKAVFSRWNTADILTVQKLFDVTMSPTAVAHSDSVFEIIASK